MNKSPEQLDATLRFIIGCVFAFTVAGMVFLSLYSVVFVTQPMSGIAPADKQFFFLLSDMSKYILGSLATLLAIKGKDVLSSKADPEPEPAVAVTPKPTPEKDDGQAT
jgi:hypothetical protein